MTTLPIIFVASLLVNQSDQVQPVEGFDVFSFPEALNQRLLNCSSVGSPSLEGTITDCECFKKELLSYSREMLLEMLIQHEQSEKLSVLSFAAYLAIRQKYPELAFGAALRYNLFADPNRGVFAIEPFRTELTKPRPFGEFKKQFDLIVRSVPLTRSINLSLICLCVPFDSLMQFYEEIDYPLPLSIESNLISMLFRRCSENHHSPTAKMLTRIRQLAILPHTISNYLSSIPESEKGKEYTSMLRTLIEHGNVSSTAIQELLRHYRKEIVARLKFDELKLAPEMRKFLEQNIYSSPSSRP
jgi:hypothetical protein